MRLVYVTSSFPHGPGEAFILPEVLELGRQGHEVWVAPMYPRGDIVHTEALQLSERAVVQPLFSREVVLGALKEFLRSPVRALRALALLLTWKPRHLLKNLIVYPKGLWLSGLARRLSADHIHAHWAATTASMAMVASEVSGIPWSFTAHRWDIVENNMLKTKVQKARFVRAISEEGRQEILKIVGKSWAAKVFVIHMGVSLPRPLAQQEQQVRHTPTIACIANLVEVKGHKYLLEACRILKDKGLRFRCLLVGEGPERRAIEEQIRALNLEDRIEMRGALPHGQVQQLLREEADIVVLPSIVTDKGEREGIPVALMEAMAYGVPVISTRTGGIPELVTEGAGILVEEKSPEQLAQAIATLIHNVALAKEMGRRGRCRVEEAFSISKNVKKLLDMMNGNYEFEEGQ
ncbi:glycosyltransferase family 4 protein [Thermoflexus sp.]|uniref:glycosyltransferase family 4 protein n=1 Tax=Thermoflexus sp. TaxID=1969742 RepID=UPI0035E455F6